MFTTFAALKVTRQKSVALLDIRKHPLKCSTGKIDSSAHRDGKGPAEIRRLSGELMNECCDQGRFPDETQQPQKRKSDPVSQSMSNIVASELLLHLLSRANESSTVLPSTKTC
jgi:hypothetical protein